jgi:hypothetical protein
MSYTDLMQALKIQIFVSFPIYVDSHTFLSFENDTLGFWILMASAFAPLSSHTTLPR